MALPPDVRREDLWCALSDLWLDTELSDERLRELAEIVRQSGLRGRALEDVFELELAPILGGNHHSPAGEWEGFDPEWLCTRARALEGKRRVRHRVAAWLGLTTYAARPAWNRVKQLAFGSGGS